MRYLIDHGRLARTRLDIGEIADDRGTAKLSRLIHVRILRSLIYTKVKAPTDDLWMGLSTDVDSRLMTKARLLFSGFCPPFCPPYSEDDA